MTMELLSFIHCILLHSTEWRFLNLLMTFFIDVGMLFLQGLVGKTSGGRHPLFRPWMNVQTATKDFSFSVTFQESDQIQPCRELFSCGFLNELFPLCLPRWDNFVENFASVVSQEAQASTHLQSPFSLGDDHPSTGKGIHGLKGFVSSQATPPKNHL